MQRKEEVSEQAEGLWSGRVGKRERTDRPRVRRIWSGKDEKKTRKILKKQGRLLDQLIFHHGMDTFQQQQQLADHREGRIYEEKSAVFQESAEKEGWGGMLVRVDLVVTYGRHAPVSTLLNIIFPMPEEQTVGFEAELLGQEEITPYLKPVIDRIVQLYFEPEWIAMGIRFNEDAPLALEERMILEKIRRNQLRGIFPREGEVLDLRDNFLWWTVESSRQDKHRLGSFYMNAPRGTSSGSGSDIDNVPPDTAAIKSITIVPTNEDEEYRSNWVLWHSFEDLKKYFRVDKIDQQTVRSDIFRDRPEGLTSDRYITIVADPEETELFLDTL